MSAHGPGPDAQHVIDRRNQIWANSAFGRRVDTHLPYLLLSLILSFDLVHVDGLLSASLTDSLSPVCAWGLL